MSTVEVVVKITLPDGHEATLTRKEAEKLASDIRLSLGTVDIKLPDTLPSKRDYKTIPWQPYYPPYYWEEKLDHVYRPGLITC